MRDATREPLPRPRSEEEDEERDEGDENAGNFGALISNFDDEPLDGDEDAEGPPTMSSFDLEEPLDHDTFDEQTSPDLRFGPDSVLPEEDDGGVGDAQGLEGDAFSDAAEPEDALPVDDGRDGVDDDEPLVNDLDLPELDADEDGTADVHFGSLVAASERSWPMSPRPYQLTRLSPEREPCGALTLAGSAVIAGSTDLLWLDAGRSAPVRLAVDGSRIAALAPIGASGDCVLAVTVGGRLVRRARLASDSERLGELGARGEPAPGHANALELVGLAPAEPRSVLGRRGRAPLSRSDDAGNTFRPLEPRLVASALATGSGLVVLLLEGGRELALSSDGARSFERRPLEGAARKIADGDAPWLAVSESALVLADAERGLVLSTDRGLSFREVPGCASATAASPGLHGGRACVFVALYSETADLTRLLALDSESGAGEIVATLSGSGGDDESGVTARVERLAWTGTRLFAAGDAGFWLVEPR